MQIQKNGPNSTIVALSSAVILVSYQTPVAAFLDGRYIKTSTIWSQTTTKQIKKFIGKLPSEPVDQSVLDDLLANTISRKK